MLVLGLGGLTASIALRNDRLGDDLVEDAVRLSGNRNRPAHRGPPIDGTFEECLAPLVDQALDGGNLEPASRTFSYQAPEAVKADLGALLDGGLSLASAQTRIQNDFKGLDGWAGDIAACTRAHSVGLVEGLGPFSNWSHARDGTTMVMQVASKVNGLGIRNQLSEGHPQSALVRCADGLASARDMTLDKGLVGGMVATSMLRILISPCAGAIEQSAAEELVEFTSQVRTIREGLPPFKGILQIERAQMQLMIFGKQLSASQRAKLPPGALSMTNNMSGAPDFKRSLVLWISWGRYARQMEAKIEIADSPRRDEILAAMDSDVGLLDLLLNEGTPPTSWVAFARRYDNAFRALDLLESAARVRIGGKPVAGVEQSTESEGAVLSIEWFPNERRSIPIPAPAGH